MFCFFNFKCSDVCKWLQTASPLADHLRSIADQILVRPCKGMPLLYKLNGFGRGDVVDEHEIEGNNLWGSVHAGRAVHVDLVAIAEQIAEKDDSTGPFGQEIFFVHVLDGVGNELDPVFLAKFAEVVRGESVCG